MFSEAKKLTYVLDFIWIISLIFLIFVGKELYYSMPFTNSEDELLMILFAFLLLVTIMTCIVSITLKKIIEAMNMESISIMNRLDELEKH